MASLPVLKRLINEKHYQTQLYLLSNNNEFYKLLQKRKYDKMCE